MLRPVRILNTKNTGWQVLKRSGSGIGLDIDRDIVFVAAPPTRVALISVGRK